MAAAPLHPLVAAATLTVLLPALTFDHSTDGSAVLALVYVGVGGGGAALGRGGPLPARVLDWP